VQPGGHPGHPKAIAGVHLLGDEAGQLVQPVRLLAVVGVLDHQALLALFQHRWHRGEREHAHRQHLPANQCVDEAGLAALELADHRDLQPQGLEATGCLGG
jgi:ABC-type transporter Mla MlaB component